jgi:hypothetical protein
VSDSYEGLAIGWKVCVSRPPAFTSFSWWRFPTQKYLEIALGGSFLSVVAAEAIVNLSIHIVYAVRGRAIFQPPRRVARLRLVVRYIWVVISCYRIPLETNSRRVKEKRPCQI